MKIRNLKRGHGELPYSKESFSDWMITNENFTSLINDWASSNYNVDFTPSIDRLDNSKGYSFDNIELVTWKENNKRGNRDMRLGKVLNGVSPQIPVSQFTLEGKFIRDFVSVAEAQRHLNRPYLKITNACRGEYKQAGGFIWKFKNKENE